MAPATFGGSKLMEPQLLGSGDFSINITFEQLKSVK